MLIGRLRRETGWRHRETGPAEKQRFFLGGGGARLPEKNLCASVPLWPVSSVSLPVTSLERNLHPELDLPAGPPAS